MQSTSPHKANYALIYDIVGGPPYFIQPSQLFLFEKNKNAFLLKFFWM